MKAYITGIGWLTATGLGRGDDPFTAPYLEVPVPSGSELFQSPDSRFGRMDRFSKTGVGAIAMALRDAGIAGNSKVLEAGLTASTRFGCIETDMEFFKTVLSEEGNWPSPHLFAYTLPSCFLGEAALRFGLTGPSYIVHSNNSFSLAGVEAAFREMEDSGIQLMVAGACDPALPPELEHQFEDYCRCFAGVAFVVLNSAPGPGTKRYAVIEEKSGEILVNNERVESLEKLIVRAKKL